MTDLPVQPGRGRCSARGHGLHPWLSEDRSVLGCSRWVGVLVRDHLGQQEQKATSTPFHTASCNMHPRYRAASACRVQAAQPRSGSSARSAVQLSLEVWLMVGGLQPGAQLASCETLLFPCSFGCASAPHRRQTNATGRLPCLPR